MGKGVLLGELGVFHETIPVPSGIAQSFDSVDVVRGGFSPTVEIHS